MRIGLMTGLLAAPFAASAASFDCAQASTRVEKTICADRKLSALDDSLAAAYEQALAASGNTASLRAGQREWLTRERDACRDAACIKSAYTKRIAELSSGGKSTLAGALQNAARVAASRTAIPVYVPAAIGGLSANADDICVSTMSNRDSFSINLHWRAIEYGRTEPLPCEDGGGDATFVAAIHGESRPMPDLSGRAQKITLKSGAEGWFLPAACGVSCAPATLYWQMPGASYWLQVKYAAKDPATRQRQNLLDTVNSLALVPRIASQPSVDVALLTAARSVAPHDLTEIDLRQRLQAGLWNDDPAAVAVSIPRGNQYLTLVFRHQPDGTWSAVDASWVARTAFGFWGFAGTEIERFETEPVSWRMNREHLLLQIRTRGWRNGQRYTAQDEFLVSPDGTVSGR